RTMSLRLQNVKNDLQRYPASASIYLLPSGDAPPAGHQLRQPNLADSYRTLAQKGPDWFYKGAFARQAEAWMQANGGLASYEDFANYQIKIREPVVASFKGYEIHGFPTPSSGGTHVAQILAMLEPQPLEKL